MRGKISCWLRADEARKIAKEVRSKKITDQLDQVMLEINVKAQNGDYAVYWKGDLLVEVVEKLTLMGYSVEPINRYYIINIL